MAHNKHQNYNNYNKDINAIYPDKESYLKLTKSFKSLLPDIIVKKHEGVNVVREDLVLQGGTKSRAAEFLISSISKQTLVYVTPRVGLAGFAIMELAKLYGKDVVFFMPACKQVSDHQAALINMNPKEIVFERIAAMPNLNQIARKYAEQNGYEFLPFGLNHPYTIAGFVRVCEDILKNYNEPEEMWTAVSTGVLTRGIQIGFQNCNMYGVAVARNMKYGELGRTNIISEPLGFYANEKKENLPPFDTVPSYDAKVWKYIPKNTSRDIWFWNVAKNIVLNKDFDKSKINSYKNWKKNETN